MNKPNDWRKNKVIKFQTERRQGLSAADIENLAVMLQKAKDGELKNFVIAAEVTRPVPKLDMYYETSNNVTFVDAVSLLNNTIIALHEEDKEG